MNLSLGIVGLPNVGKSTLFNALTNQNIPAENFPFCTIEPNTGIVPVSDPRIDVLFDLIKPKRKVPAIIKFVDIAGIVKGASSGEGLGNKFLSHIREVDAIVQVVRSFESEDIIHVENKIDPKSDLEVVESELILKDLETVDKHIYEIERKSKGDKKIAEVLEEYRNLKSLLESGKLAINADSHSELYKEDLKQLNLLTNKPFIYILNISGEQNSDKIMKSTWLEDKNVIPLDIKLEAEIAQLPESERAEYIKELGLEESGLDKLTRACYEVLGLISFFTAGEMEVRAWTITNGMTAPEAAGVIHTDFQNKFVAAEIVAYNDFIAEKGWLGAKNSGKARLEGKEYVMKDGDVAIFKHGA